MVEENFGQEGEQAKDEYLSQGATTTSPPVPAIENEEMGTAASLFGGGAPAEPDEGDKNENPQNQQSSPNEEGAFGQEAVESHQPLR